MEKPIPESTYEVIDPELTIISEKGDLGVSLDGSRRVSGRCLGAVTNQIRSWEERNIKQNREHKHLLDICTHNMNTLCSDHLISKGTRKGSGKSSKGHQRYGMASIELSAEED